MAAVISAVASRARHAALALILISLACSCAMAFTEAALSLVLAIAPCQWNCAFRLLDERACGIQQLRPAERLRQDCGAGKCARQAFATVTGHEHEGYLPARQRRRNVVDRPAVEVAVNQGGVDRSSVDDRERLFGRAGGPHHLSARLLPAGDDVHRDERLGLDDEEATSRPQ